MKVKNFLALAGLALALCQPIKSLACETAGTFSIQATVQSSAVTGTSFHFGGAYWRLGDSCVAKGGGNLQMTVTEDWTWSEVEFPVGMTLYFQFRAGEIVYNPGAGVHELIAELRPVGTTKNFLLANGGEELLNDWIFVIRMPIGDIYGVSIPAPWDPSATWMRFTVTARSDLL